MPTAPTQSRTQTFANIAVSLLSAPSSMGGLTDDQWKSLEVNPDTIRQNLQNRDEIESYIERFNTTPGLEFLCGWFGLNQDGTIQEMYNRVVDHIVANSECHEMKILLSVIHFMKNRSFTAFERYAELILPQGDFQPVQKLSISETAKKLYYVLAVYDQDPVNLRALMLYSDGERRSFIRRELDLALDEDDDDADRQAAQNTLDQGLQLNQLDQQTIENGLQQYTTQQHGRPSRFFAVHWDERGQGQGDRLVFVLRYRGERPIRELNDVLFADEATFVILRFSNSGRIVDTHPRTKHERWVADAVIQEALDTNYLQYRPTADLVTEGELFGFVRRVRQDNDPDLKLTEVRYTNAPIDGSPELMLRANKGESVSESLDFLEDRTGIEFIDEMEMRDIRHVVFSFHSTIGGEEGTIYKFKVWFDTTRVAGELAYHPTFDTPADGLTQFRD